MTARKWFRWVVVGGLTLAAVFAAWFWIGRRGIEVSIRNAGSAPLLSVSVEVTGRTYTLGDIRANEVVAVVVEPTGESHLDIAFSDLSGNTRRLNAGGYFEPGYHGTIDVSVKDGVIEETVHNTRP